MSDGRMYRPGSVVPFSGFFALCSPEAEVFGDAAFMEKGKRFPPPPSKGLWYISTEPDLAPRRDPPSQGGSDNSLLHPKSPVTGRTYPDLAAEIAHKIGSVLVPVVLMGAVGGLVWFITERFETQRLETLKTTNATFVDNTKSLNETYEKITTVSKQQIDQLEKIYKIADKIRSDNESLERERRDLDSRKGEVEREIEELRVATEILLDENANKGDNLAVEHNRLINRISYIELARNSDREDAERKLSRRAEKIREIGDSLSNLIHSSEKYINLYRDVCAIKGDRDSILCKEILSVMSVITNMRDKYIVDNTSYIARYFGQKNAAVASELEFLIGEEMSDEIIFALESYSNFARSFLIPDLSIKYYFVSSSVSDDHYADTMSIQVNADNIITAVSTQRKLFQISSPVEYDLLKQYAIIYVEPYEDRYLDFFVNDEVPDTWSFSEQILQDYKGVRTEELSKGDERRVEVIDIIKFRDRYEDLFEDMIEQDGSNGRINGVLKILDRADKIDETMRSIFGSERSVLSEGSGKAFRDFIYASAKGELVRSRQLVGLNIEDGRLGHMAAVALQEGFAVRKVTRTSEEGKNEVEIVGEISNLKESSFKSVYVWTLSDGGPGDTDWRIVSFRERLDEKG